MSNDEWAPFEPFRSAERLASDDQTTTALYWTAFSGSRAPERRWRDLHEHFGKWSSVYRRFRRRTLARLRDLLLGALNETEGVGESIQMIDPTIIRAHPWAAGAKGELRVKGLARSRGGFTTKNSPPHERRRTADSGKHYRGRGLGFIQALMR